MVANPATNLPTAPAQVNDELALQSDDVIVVPSSIVG
jgi:hypothetical protein